MHMDPALPAYRASTSVVAAGVVAIIGGSFAAISILASFFIISRISLPSYPTAINPAMRPILYATWTFFLLCAAFVIVAGAHVIRLRNWARIALLVVAGGALLFGTVGLGVIFVTIYFTPADPAVSKPLLASVLAFIYGLPILVAIWWLVLFTRRAVVGQFHAATVPRLEGTRSSASLLNNPECPLAIRIVGWYLASFVLFLPVLPFVYSRIPALYFGHVLRGPAAMSVHFISFAILATPGIGLLLLKRWSWPLAVATQLLFSLNCLVIAFSSAFDSNLRAVYDGWGIPAPLAPETAALLREMRWIFLISVVMPLAILVVLCIYRRAFYSAAEIADKRAFSS
jgi:hypothetical protein